MSSAASSTRSSAEATIERRYEKVRLEGEEVARAVDEKTSRLRSLRLAREKQEGARSKRTTTGAAKATKVG